MFTSFLRYARSRDRCSCSLLLTVSPTLAFRLLHRLFFLADDLAVHLRHPEQCSSARLRNASHLSTLLFYIMEFWAALLYALGFFFCHCWCGLAAHDPAGCRGVFSLQAGAFTVAGHVASRWSPSPGTTLARFCGTHLARPMLCPPPAATKASVRSAFQDIIPGGEDRPTW